MSLERDGAPPLIPIPTPDLHLSLSRTVPIVDAQRHSLLAELTKAIHKVVKKARTTTRTTFKPLDVRIGDGTLFLTNDDRSRTFLALTADDGHAPSLLHALVDATSSVFTRHGLPGYYEEKRMHVSIAWCPGDGRGLRASPVHSPCPPFILSVDSVTCRIGKKDHSIDL